MVAQIQTASDWIMGESQCGSDDQTEACARRLRSLAVQVIVVVDLHLLVGVQEAGITAVQQVG